MAPKSAQAYTLNPPSLSVEQVRGHVQRLSENGFRLQDAFHHLKRPASQAEFTMHRWRYHHLIPSKAHKSIMSIS